jgi:hypothetical protein
MNWQPKRVVMAFAPWIVASVLLYALGSLEHQRVIQVVAFIATSLGILFGVLTYRFDIFRCSSRPQVRTHSRRLEHNFGWIALLDYDLGTLTTLVDGDLFARSKLSTADKPA